MSPNAVGPGPSSPQRLIFRPTRVAKAAYLRASAGHLRVLVKIRLEAKLKLDIVQHADANLSSRME